MNPIPTPGYTMNQSSLERWRDGCLTLVPGMDGSIDAALHFEGATCSGIPLTMVYRVSVSSEADGRRIRAMGCEPLAGTDGHERMCSYMHTSGRILQIANDEKPLLGEPLDAVLSWRPKTYAAGCLCATPSRDHKWSSVLQTLHFALHHQVEL